MRAFHRLDFLKILTEIRNVSRRTLGLPRNLPFSVGAELRKRCHLIRKTCQWCVPVEFALLSLPMAELAERFEVIENKAESLCGFCFRGIGQLNVDRLTKVHCFLLPAVVPGC